MGRQHLRLVVDKSHQTAKDSAAPTELRESALPLCGCVDAQKIYTAALFKKYRNLLLRYLERRLHNKEDAMELLQETYIKLLRQNSLNHLEENVKGYIFKIASNLIVDKLRNEQAKRSYEHIELNESKASDKSQSPHQQTEWREALDRLKEAIAELTPRARQVFVLHRFNNLTYSEIAKTLGVTTRTVERDMSTAMAFCEQRLKEFL